LTVAFAKTLPRRARTSVLATTTHRLVRKTARHRLWTMM
jgi:hypothetical protein